MKIGILTFHLSLNYGSALQAWALKHAINKLSHNVEIINFQPENYMKLYGGMLFPSSKRALKHDILYFSRKNYFKNRNRAFSDFVADDLEINGRRIIERQEFEQECEKYDAVICGSDQIWNPSARDFDIYYFFPEVKKTRKVAYAVSLNKGDLIHHPNAKKFAEWISDFSYLSVREESGADQLRAITNRKKPIYTMPDPTLLISKEEWNSLIDVEAPAEPYIFYYSVRQTEQSVKKAIDISQHLSCPMYSMISGVGSLSMLKYQKFFRLPENRSSPKDFLAFIQGASYIVTDSFHGTVLSSIMRKPFVVIENEINSKEISDYRIRDFLTKFSLERQVIKIDQTIHPNLFFADFKQFDHIISSVQDRAYRFLDDSIAGELD